MITKKENGFTLVELMIVVVIIGILASIAIPKFATIITRAKVTEAKTILKQIVDMEKTYYSMFDNYEAIAFGASSVNIGYSAPNPAEGPRFQYNFVINGTAADNPPFTGSLATAQEIVDVNGDGDTADGLTLDVAYVQGIIAGSGINW
jgi:prepilin-type N-terminal cleavage/methylation domain-containing protein